MTETEKSQIEIFDRYKKALEGLTPGGSEFVDDPERCARFVCESRDTQMRGMQMREKRAKAKEAKLELWDEMLAALEALSWAESKFQKPCEADISRLEEAFDSCNNVIEKVKQLK